MQENQLFILLRKYSFSILITSIGGGTEGAWGALALPLFSGRALIYAFISTALPLHECILNLIDLPSKLKPVKELKSRDVFFKILFVRWGNRN